MARIKQNLATEGMSGRIKQFVYRQLNGKTVVSSPPQNTSPASPAQQAVRDLFRAANVYAQGVADNPELLTFYKKIAGKGKSVFNVAMADYCKPPEIGEVNTYAYTGSVGEQISIKATDNGKVMSVKLKIENSSGLVEEGSAVINNMDKNFWLYDCTAANGSLAGSIITVTATDRAGRISVHEKTL